ncbi:MAG TPA: helix-turn-helix domain-containing protein [Solimonas sp.]|nr:helix-turn-helix domain-containing protein [Solimonas sp.]
MMRSAPFTPNPAAVQDPTPPDPYRQARFHIGRGYALYEGPAGDNAPHRHAAFQVAIALQGEVVFGDGLREHRGPVLVVPPLQRHQLMPHRDLRCFFIEPHCSFADELRAVCGPGITAMPALRQLSEEQVRSRGGASAQVDPRLQQVMAALSRGNDEAALPVLAQQAGLSPQRLRALAREQLGMPLARWRIWQRLRLAASALRRGESLAEAALAAGFADQAHFSRTMREMFGVTPSVVLPLLRAQGLPAT